ncbi:MAG TPA: acyl-CoA carboxylase subunit epsilon [Actinomycetes bacterium]
MSDAPLLRVVRGEPDDTELAALLAVLAASAAGAGTGDAPAASPWRDRARSVHAPVQHGPGAWRTASLPQ